MAEVLQAPLEADKQPFYQVPLLRHSSSSPTMFLDSSSPNKSLSTSPRSHPAVVAAHHSHPSSLSLPTSISPASSAPSTTDFSDSGSYTVQSGSSDVSPDAELSDDNTANDEDDANEEHAKSEGTNVGYSHFGSVSFFNFGDDNGVMESILSDGEEINDLLTATESTRSESPLPTPTVADDTAVRVEPSRHVDYLSHNWREEDIWSSWRHIVSQRKTYGQRSRLENASWRTWSKSKYKLATVAPATLNWLKDSDVTWLYGPLKPATSHPISSETPGSASRVSKNSSFINVKPILKKRSMSEIMLQKSLMSTSLLKQAAASIQAQGGARTRGSIGHNMPIDLPVSAVPSEIPSRDQVDYFTSCSSSSGGTPCDGHEKRHIRFDETVEQCIAVECKDGDFEDDLSDDAGMRSDSSDEGLVMKRRRRVHVRPQRRKSDEKASRSNSLNGRKTIETLPTTTLKYRTDSPDITDQTRNAGGLSRVWSSSRLSPSPSQETLRPSHPSKNYLKHKEEANDVEETAWAFGVSNPKSSLGESSGIDSPTRFGREPGSSSRTRSTTPGPSMNSEYTPEGLRRTSSGMFMPYDEDEEDNMGVGIFGRVSETINTARDIAHVIWNVGWRK